MGVIEDMYGEDGYEVYTAMQNGSYWGGSRGGRYEYYNNYDDDYDSYSDHDDDYDDDYGFYARDYAKSREEFNAHVTQTVAISSTFCLTVADLAKVPCQKRTNPRHPLLAPMKLYAKTALAVRECDLLKAHVFRAAARAKHKNCEGLKAAQVARVERSAKRRRTIAERAAAAAAGAAASSSEEEEEEDPKKNPPPVLPLTAFKRAKLLVPQLKMHLKARGLPTGGLKADLVARVEAYMADPANAERELGWRRAAEAALAEEEERRKQSLADVTTVIDVAALGEEAAGAAGAAGEGAPSEAAAQGGKKRKAVEQPAPAAAAAAAAEAAPAPPKPEPPKPKFVCYGCVLCQTTAAAAKPAPAKKAKKAAAAPTFKAAAVAPKQPAAAPAAKKQPAPQANAGGSSKGCQVAGCVRQPAGKCAFGMCGVCCVFLGCTRHKGKQPVPQHLLAKLPAAPAAAPAAVKAAVPAAVKAAAPATASAAAMAAAMAAALAAVPPHALAPPASRPPLAVIMQQAAAAPAPTPAQPPWRPANRRFSLVSGVVVVHSETGDEGVVTSLQYGSCQVQYRRSGPRWAPTAADPNLLNPVPPAVNDRVVVMDPGALHGTHGTVYSAGAEDGTLLVQYDDASIGAHKAELLGKYAPA